MSLGHFFSAEVRKHLEDLENSLKCKICNKVAVNPRVFSNCQHFFCDTCTNFNSNCCAVCGVPTYVKEIVPDKFIENVTKCMINIKDLLCLPPNVEEVWQGGETSTKTPDSELIDDQSLEKLTDEESGKRTSTKLTIEDEVDKSEMVETRSSSEFNPTNSKHEDQTTRISSRPRRIKAPPKVTQKPGLKEKPAVTRLSCKLNSVDSKDENQITSPKKRINEHPKLGKVDEPKIKEMRGTRYSSKLRQNKSKEQNQENPNSYEQMEMINSPKLIHKDDFEVPVVKSSHPNTSASKPMNGAQKRISEDATKKSLNLMETTPTKHTQKSFTDESPKIITNSAKKTANKRNAKGETPLQVACVKNNVSLVLSLLKNGANPNVKDNAGWTPLHEAIQNKNLDILKLLLERGKAWVNTPGVCNFTPLHKAAILDWLDGVKLLLEYGANPRIVTIYGFKPVKLAQSEEVIQIIQKYEVTHMPCNVTNPILSEVYTLDERPVFFGINLTKSERKLLATLSSLIPGSKTTSTYSSDVTHLVVKTNDGVCCPNLNIINGILTGKLIVTLPWIEHSIKVKSVKHYRNLGVRGTKTYPESSGLIRSRLCHRILLPGLFSGMHFSMSPCLRNFQYEDVRKEDLVTLMKLGGGSFLTREPDPEGISIDEMTVPFHANNSLKDFADFTRSTKGISSSESTLDKFLTEQLGLNWKECITDVKDDHPLKKCSHVILYHQDNSPSAAHNSQRMPNLIRYNMSHLKSLPVAWFIGCIESYTLLDPLPFI